MTTTANSGAGSLRQSILDAQPGETIVFNPNVFSSSVILQLAGQIEISKSLTIDGSGAGVVTPTLSAGAFTRTFQIDGGAALTLNRLNLINASCSCEGGAIYVSTSASIVMSYTTLFGNTATVGGAIFNKGTAQLNDSSLTNNYASYGGAIRNYGMLSANHVIIAGNSALYGGAILNYGFPKTAILVISNSAIYNNHAISTTSPSGYGGGIHNLDPASITMTNTTLYGNSATMDGGAISNGANTDLNMVNTTIYANAAMGNGGGITSMGHVTFTNSIISGNTGGNCAGQWGMVVDLGANIEDANTCGLGSGSRTMANPLFGAFGIYQPGSIPTVPLQRGSVAINAAIDAACPLTDARGVLRTQGGHCDIGAYEAFANYTFVPLVLR